MHLFWVIGVPRQQSQAEKGPSQIARPQMCRQVQPGPRRLVYYRGTGQGTPAAKGLGRVSWRKYQHRAAKLPRCGTVGTAGERECTQRAEGREPHAQDLQVTGGPCSSPRSRARETGKMCHFIGVWLYL